MACHHNTASLHHTARLYYTASVQWASALHWLCGLPEFLGTAPLHSIVAPFQHSAPLPHVALLSHCFTALHCIGHVPAPGPAFCTASLPPYCCPLWDRAPSRYYHWGVGWWPFPGFCWQPQLSSTFAWIILTAHTSAPPCTPPRGLYLHCSFGPLC